MKNDKEFDEYLNHLDASDQQALNAYMDSLDFENNSELDEYLDRIEEGVQGGYDMAPEATQGLGSYIELEPQIESFQDYTTTRLQPVSPETIDNSEQYVTQQTAGQSDQYVAQQTAGQSDQYVAQQTVGQSDQYVTQQAVGESVQTVNPLDVSLLDDEYEQPFVDTLRYKDDEEATSKDRQSKSPDNNKSYDKYDAGNYKDNVNDYDSVMYIDNVSNQSKAPVVLAIICILAIICGGVFATYHFTDGFKDFAFFKKGAKNEQTTEIPKTTEATTEEVTTEEPVGPYATVDYTLHEPHATDSTIVYNSNPFSLRFPKEEWPIFRDDNDEQRDATQEELYPSITLEARDGSLNSTNPVPDNLAETQTLTSRYMVLVDLSDDSIVAKRDSDVVVNPASMTKILTVLTAADLIEDLDDTFIMTDEAIKYAYDNGGSAVGFLAGEKVTVRDLIYGTIVCSGADAAVGLAQYCCGSHEAFVEKMNDKAKELGIDDTAHFTNVVGMYDENLHCTMEDMAIILATAMQNDLLKEVLNARTYQTTPDPTVLPEDVRKELGLSEDGSSEAENTEAENTEATGENETTEASAEAGDGETANDAEATTEEIDPGVKLIATEGIQISNWFMRRIEDKDTGGEVLGAKTGFVNAAGFCCASYYKSNSGKEYVCVTGDTYSSWRCIYDHVGIYRSLAN